MDLEVQYEVACGLDVHSATIAACLVRNGPKGSPLYEARSFPTTLRGLTDLRDWLVAEKCQAVGMEATGVYWMPVYSNLEGHVHLVVGNPSHMKNLRGHKTDRKDAKWIASLMRHGLIRPSFVPPPVFRNARALTRARRQLIEARTAVRNEILRGLASQGLPLAKVLTNVFGVSGMAILEALAEGRSVKEELPKLVHRSVLAKLPALQAAIEAPLEEVPRVLLALGLKRHEELEDHIQDMERRIETQLLPHRDVKGRLMAIPGISTTAANVILAELGVDMSPWPTAAHIAAWAGLAPGSRESGGKRMAASTRKGNTHLKTMLVEAASAAVRTKSCHLKNTFHRLRARMGYKKAIVAMAHKLLVIIYTLLTKNREYEEPKLSQTLSEKARKRAVKKRIEDLKRLGYLVEIKEIPTEAPPEKKRDKSKKVSKSA